MSNFIGMVFASLKNEGIDTSGMSTDEAVKKYNELQKKTGGKAGADQPTPAENRRVGADKITPNENRKMWGAEPDMLDENQLKLLPKMKKEHLEESIDWYNQLYENNKGKQRAQQIKRFIDAYEKELNNRNSVVGETSNKPKYNTNFNENQEIDWDLAEKNEKINGSKAKNPNRHDKWGNELLSDEAFNVGLEAGKSYLDYVTKYNDLNTLKRSNVFLGGLDETITNAITNNGFNPKNDTTYQDKNEIIGNLLGEEVDMEKYGIDATKGFTGRKYIGYKPK